MKRVMQAWAVLWLLGQAAAASAHEGSTSYLLASAGPDTLTARFDVALIDVAWAVPLDGDADGRLTWNEVWAGRGDIADYLARTIRFSRGGERCAAEVGEPWLTDRLGLPYLSVDMALQCPGAGVVGIASDAFFDADASHRVLVSLESRDSADVTTLSPENRAWSEPAARSGWRTALAFIAQGIWHVWIGYDHLLFLLLLLLPAVTTRVADGTGRGRAIALDLVRVVTAFTVAHSITLIASAYDMGPDAGWFPPLVETPIALSIVIAACLNLAPSLARFRLPLAFGFGLVHGFGFANALAGLGAGGTRWPALAGFNIGVEIANLAVIAVLLPILLQAGRRRWYAPRALPALSLVSAAIGAAWLADRL